MSKNNVMMGTDALDALNEGGGEVESNKFSYLKSGTSYTVKVPGINIISAFVYGSYGKNIYSFIAENESKKSKNGYPTENLTPFDKVWKYYKDQSSDWQDKLSQEANHFGAKRKFTLGFYDLDVGGPIMVEFTRNQAGVIVDTIKKNDKYLDKFAFVLSKTGTGTSTKVDLSLIPMLDDLTDEQRNNFSELPNDFDNKYFEGLYYEMSDEDQIDTLIKTGFDVTKVGLEAPIEQVDDGNDVNNISTDELLDGAANMGGNYDF